MDGRVHCIFIERRKFVSDDIIRVTLAHEDETHIVEFVIKGERARERELVLPVGGY